MEKEEKPDDTTYQLMVDAIFSGRLVPFLGAGVNLSKRPPKPWCWNEGAEYLPSGGELSEFFCNKYQYPVTEETQAEKYDLLRVTQYILAKGGDDPIYDDLHELLNMNFPFTPLHEFLAKLPRLLRDASASPRFPLIVTTNYDDVLERALEGAGEAFDVIYYETRGNKEKGKFWHQPHGKSRELIEVPNEYNKLPINLPDHDLQTTVILKIHGTISREDRANDSYVITEDDYIEYSSYSSTLNFMPKQLQAKLQRSQFLFMGYSLRDWNLRIILNRLWKERKGKSKSWAIQLRPNEIDRMFWEGRTVTIFDMTLDEFAASLEERLRKKADGVAGGKKS